MNEADKILLRFFDSQCDDCCDDCRARKLCDEANIYLSDKGYWQNGSLMVEESEIYDGPITNNKGEVK